MTKPFWETKSLSEMSPQEWESLCDGCGLCCLIRFEDEDTGDIIPTRVHCKLFDSETCACSDYVNRQKHVPDCLRLTPEMIGQLSWLPKSCGYRRVHEGRGLADWHPLVSGDPQTVHTAGVSIQHQTISEALLVNEEDALDFEASDWLEERGVA
jgi:uncharacterized cysteine cluster protein YcgN (CxxCxxCC family)